MDQAQVTWLSLCPPPPKNVGRIKEDAIEVNWVARGIGGDKHTGLGKEPGPVMQTRTSLHNPLLLGQAFFGQLFSGERSVVCVRFSKQIHHDSTVFIKKKAVWVRGAEV